MPLGITVTTGETAGSAGSSIQTGTAFIMGEAEWGPSTATLIKSMAAFKTAYGERATANSTLYDSVETFFQLEGQQAWVLRLFEASTTAKAPVPTAEFLGAGGANKVIKVEGKYKGTYINTWKIEVVENAGKTESKFILRNASSEIVEETAYFAKAESFPWGSTTGYAATEFATTYLVFKQGAGYSSGKAEKVKEVAAVEMKGGTAGTNPSPAESDYEAAATTLSNFPKALGPGQILCPGTTGSAVTAKVNKALGEHCQKVGHRVALCSIGDSSTAATLVTNKGTTYGNNIAGYMAFFSSCVIVPGVTAGTTRTVPAAAAVAGLCAQVAKNLNDGAAPVGVQWAGSGKGLSPFVTGFTNTFTKENMETLVENGINPFAERQSKPVLYGWVSALARTVSKIFYQFGSSRERAHLVWAGEEIGEKYFGVTIDGRGQAAASFQGALNGMLKEQWERNALYGNLAQEAFLVNVAEPVNTPTTISEGQLNAELRVRLSPDAEAVTINIISSPVTEAI